MSFKKINKNNKKEFFKNNSSKKLKIKDQS